MPLVRLEPRYVEKIWGRRDLGPTFADVPGNAPPVGEIWFEDTLGGDRALLVKYIFTSERLSIQVHPDDETAHVLGEEGGKDEAWAVVTAEPGAEIGLGLNRTVSEHELRSAALNGTLMELVDWRSVHEGDVFYVRAGTIHAIGAGVSLIEVQQNRDVTYRLFDYGRPRELHLDRALRAARREAGLADGAGQIEAGRGERWRGPGLQIDRVRGPTEMILTATSANPIWIVPISGSPVIEGIILTTGEVFVLDEKAELALAADAMALLGSLGEGEPE